MGRQTALWRLAVASASLDVVLGGRCNKWGGTFWCLGIPENLVGRTWFGHSAASHWGGQFLGTNPVRGWALPWGRATDRDSKRCRDAGGQGAKDPSIEKKRIVSGGRVGGGGWLAATARRGLPLFPCGNCLGNSDQGAHWLHLLSPSPGPPRPPPLLTDERRSFCPGAEGRGRQNCDGWVRPRRRTPRTPGPVKSLLDGQEVKATDRDHDRSYRSAIVSSNFPKGCSGSM